MILLDKVDVTWIIALCVLVPIFSLLIVATVIAVIKRIKLAKKYKGNNITINDPFKNEILDAFGIDNINNVEVEMSRLTVSVKDIDLVNPEKLKELGASGVLLVGDKVKCSFKDKAKEIYDLIQEVK